MRTPLLGTLVLVAVAGSVLAQPRPYYDQSRRGDRYGYTRDDNRYGSRGAVNQAMRDLRMISSRSFVDRHEAKHLQRAMDELSRFEYRAREGVFDRGRLDRAIDNIEHLANARQLHPRDRERLREDLFNLRRFRDGGYGYRYR
ncbi:MAG: hypothetical protein ACKV22_24155 [Bryobacteraceae bacterium]